ncbi:hypothetical protein ILUMI_19915 [Ignelater luminosus]|uniref:Uncharacterized protein n=1 Tax=Ignelater luminosus TaxID=2038154 RepID=A0A8K0G517_IGNLU|nr:hypothetical protein ILUMI_19915 [Ignelater luminosus]
MYLLYLEFCDDKKIKPVSQTLYRENLILKNIVFYQPRRDRCWRYEYDPRRPQDQAAKLEEYQLYRKRKDAANSAKKENGERAKNDKIFVSVNFDLETVLYCPLFFAKPIFYKRKLAIYNFTIYEVATKQGHCFLWDETSGKRKANEIATRLSIFIDNLAASDNCPGQNKNSIVASMLSYCLSKSTLKSVEGKFLEVQCDSMHATIKTAFKNVKITLPSD